MLGAAEETEEFRSGPDELNDANEKLIGKIGE
jgi:hypothetical protein